MINIFNIFFLKIMVVKNKIRRISFTDAAKFGILLLFVMVYSVGGQHTIALFFDRLREIPMLKELSISKLWVSQIILLFFSAFTPFLIFGGLVSFIPTFLNKKEIIFNTLNNFSLFPIFIYNYFEVILKNFIFIAIATSPLLLAYGRIFASGGVYFIITPVVIFMFTVILVSCGLFCGFIVLGFSPRIKVRPVINWGTFLFTIFIIYNLVVSNPLNVIGKDFVDEFLKYAQTLKEPSGSFNISLITNSALTGIVFKQYSLAIANFLKLAGASILLILVNILIGYGIFKKKIISVMEENGADIGTFIKPSVEDSKSYMNILFKKSPMISKELIYLHRDHTILLQLSMIIVLAAAFIINILKTINLDGETAMFYLRLSYPASVLLLTIFAGRLVFPAISAEGKNIWLIKMSPFGMRRFVYTKYFLFFAIQFLFVFIFLTTVNFMYGFWGAIYITGIFSFWISIILTGIGFILGILLADFSENDPWKIATGLGGVIFFITSFTFSAFPVLLAVISYGKQGYRKPVIWFSLFLAVGTFFLALLIINKLIYRLEKNEI
ncbi:MAG: hypothetical protein BWY26_00631 [Elusimicrobia bacterium ADurb.Bin231]|nr:MAG: hypothetical protein BWY26_00631 [Elusimicrobia bacterium ADurb.Bin231]